MNYIISLYLKGSSIFFPAAFLLFIIIALNRNWVGMKHYCNLFYAFLCAIHYACAVFYEQNKEKGREVYFCVAEKNKQSIQSDVSGFARGTRVNTFLFFLFSCPVLSYSFIMQPSISKLYLTSNIKMHKNVTRFHFDNQHPDELQFLYSSNHTTRTTV